MQPRRESPVAGVAQTGWMLWAGILGAVLLLALSSVGMPAISGAGAIPAGRSLTSVPGTPSGAIPVAAMSPSSPTPLVTTLENVTFRASGLSDGSLWSVTAGSPAVQQNNTTADKRGSMTFQEPNGTL